MIKLELTMNKCFVVFLFSTISFLSNGQNAAQKMKEALSSGDYRVSMITLIAAPEKYHDKGVHVIGYLNLEFEGNAIFLDELDFENSNTKNAIWLSFSRKADMKEIMKLNGKYVMIQGVFNKDYKGHMSLFAGSIDEIIQVDEVKKRTR